VLGIVRAEPASGVPLGALVAVGGDALGALEQSLLLSVLELVIRSGRESRST
jgi:hypothetical protein